MKAYIQNGKTAHLELTFNEFTELQISLSASVRGARCTSQLAVDMESRIGKMWDYWMNGSDDKPKLEHRPGGVAIVGKQSASPPAPRTPDPGNLEAPKQAELSPSTKHQS